jgi:DNA-binding transcriptional ArsR family regulator
VLTTETRSVLDLSDVLHALSDPVRRHIVVQLDRHGETSCGRFGLTVTKSTATHHFRVLREAGVVRQRAEGTARMNTLRREDLDARFPGLLDTILSSAPEAT